MHDLDAILQAACPTLMVPKFGELEPLTESGHRFLAAADGLWVEVKRPWLHLVWPVALQDEFAMPYGTLDKKIQFAFGHIPSELMQLFVADSIAALPDEFGAWLVWDDIQKELKYRPLKSIEAGPDYLKVDRPDLDDHESMAVDLHSHGHFNAGFSPTDNRDDHGEVKLSGVVGKLGAAEPTVVFRLCAAGKFISIGVGSSIPKSAAPCPRSTGVADGEARDTLDALLGDTETSVVCGKMIPQ